MCGITVHNAPLKREMEAKGYRWRQGITYAHFVDEQGDYVPFPSGYITGPSKSSGSPTPWYCSVRIGEYWVQRSFETADEARSWALNYVKENEDEIQKAS